MKRDYTPPPHPPVLYVAGERVGRVIGRLPDGRVRVERWGGGGELVVAAGAIEGQEQP